jgi:predicted ATPase
MARRLPLTSLAVEGYRAIRELRIAKLGQVNLFVGKNNVGKTSLLEAIRLYVSRNAPTVLSQLFAEKSSRSYAFRNSRVTSEAINAIAAEAEAFFYGSFSHNPLSSIRIGPAGMRRDVLEITLPWADTIQTNGGSEKLRTDFFVAPESPVLKIRQGNEEVMIPFDLLLRRIPLWPSRNRTKAQMIPATGWPTQQIARLWDAVADRGMAPAVERALRSIQPDLERIYLIGESGLPGRSVRLGVSGIARPIPLNSIGDGINRVFGIALALVQAQDGVLLIDEVENGLHYTLQEEVWRAILLLAKDLRVQVFATTHSWDCIQAFAAASNDSPEVDGMLHRLERKRDDSLRTVDLNEADLAVVTRQHIEVR